MSGQSEKYLDTTLFYLYLIFIVTSTVSIAASQTALGLSLIVFAAVASLKRYNPFPSALKWFYVFVGLYVLWLFLSALVNRTPLASTLIMKEEWLFCAVPIGVYLLKSNGKRNRLITAFAVAVLLVSIYGLLQHFTGINWFKDSSPVMAPDFGYRVSGSFAHRLTFGNYYGTASVFLLAFAVAGTNSLTRPLRLLCLTASMLGIIATLLTYGRGPIAALALVLIIAGFVLGKRFFKYSAVAILVIIITVATLAPGLIRGLDGRLAQDLGGEYEGSRTFIWKNSAKIVCENPLFGVGQGNFKAAYTAKLRPDIPEIRKHAHAHNDLLNVAAVAGIPGALFFLGIWLALFLTLWKGWRAAALENRHRAYLGGAILASAFFFACSFTEAAFADEEVRQLLMFVWAAGLWTCTASREPLAPLERKNT